MSLLHQDSPEEIDDAAKGEELTKGSSHVVIASIIAALLVTIAIALYVMVGQKPPAATGEIVEVWAHPQHTVTSGYDAAGAAMAQETFDHVLVFTHVKLHNQGDKPLFLNQIATNATLEDGLHTSFAATLTDYDRVFIAYPDLAARHENGLSHEATINPGQTVEGTFVSSFRVTKQQWDARKDLSFTFAFLYQPSLTLTPHSAVTEQ
jgi:hypothetical protein